MLDAELQSFAVQGTVRKFLGNVAGHVFVIFRRGVARDFFKFGSQETGADGVIPRRIEHVVRDRRVTVEYPAHGTE